ncbi:MAG: hypothetical protein FWD73_06320 [Polyangiaceae bacterium]|nr:hypothetical protein [Polyangiaceae bacterium]
MGGWLLPALVAPWISVYVAVTAVATFGIERGVFGKVLGWALGMLVGSVWAFVYCLIGIAVDLALLSVKLRTLPIGRRAWISGLASPLVVFGVYTLAPPYTFYPLGIQAVLFAILIPMATVVLVGRVVAGQKPPR